MQTLGRALRHPFVVAVWGMAVGPWGTDPHARPLLGDDPWSEGLALLSHALLRLFGGRPADGERELLHVLAHFRSLGERWGTAQALESLAMGAGWRGEWRRADERWAEALDAYTQLGAPEECVDVLCRRAECRGRQGDVAAAAADYRRAAVLSAEVGRPSDPPAVLLGLGEIARLSGDTREAAALLGRARAAPQEDGFGAGASHARVLTALGRLAAATGEPAEAVRLHGQALAAARSSPFTAVLADAAEGQADAAVLNGSGERAALLLGAAAALRGTVLAGDADVARTASAARELVGATVFAEAYARGARMSEKGALTVLDNRDG
jgi:tetratricopeptide (TPR) repeat protein